MKPFSLLKLTLAIVNVATSGAFSAAAAPVPPTGDDHSNQQERKAKAILLSGLAGVSTVSAVENAHQAALAYQKGDVQTLCVEGVGLAVHAGITMKCLHTASKLWRNKKNEQSPQHQHRQ